MDGNSYKQYEIKEGIVFLVELTPDIFKVVPQLRRSQLAEILACIDDLLQEMVVTFPHNGVGIYFYNSQATASKFPRDSEITKIFSLNDLNSSNMKTLHSMVRDNADGFKPLPSRFPVGSLKDNLHTVLQSMLLEFQSRTHYNAKKLYWCTNNDDPYRNPSLTAGLRTLISDFEANGVTLYPFFLETYKDEDFTHALPFNTQKYQDIFLNTNFLDKEVKGLNTEQIRELIFRLKEVRRIQFSCELILSNGPGIGGQLGCGIKGYTLFNHEKVRPFKQVYTGGEYLKVTHTETESINSRTGKAIEQSEDTDDHHANKIFSGIPVKSKDGEKVLLLQREVTEFMKSYAFDHEASDGPDEVDFTKAPYLKLLCFRPLALFQPYLNTKPPLFVTTDHADTPHPETRDGMYTHSFKTFLALYRSCVRLKRFAVVIGCTKRNSSPDLYAMYPTNCSMIKLEQDMSKSQDLGVQARLPDGFLLVNIPWLNEIRSLPDYALMEKCQENLDEAASLQEQVVTVFDEIVDLFPQTEYTPQHHENPVLSYFYKVLKQEALQMDVKDEDRSLLGNDSTAREVVRVRQHSPELNRRFQLLNGILDLFGNAFALKRSAEDTDRPTKRKPDVLNEAAVISLWKTNGWQNVTLPQLKEFLARYDKIKRATRKADVVANIVEFLESRT